MFRKLGKLFLLIGLAIFVRSLISRLNREQKPDGYKPMEILVPPMPTVSEPAVQRTVQVEAPAPHEVKPPAEAIAPPAAIEPTEPDELKRIEGIGPKIATALNEAKIHRFSQLAELTPDQIRTILTQAGIRIARPDTWPEQAALAANEDWEELARLKAQLKGGRRTTE